ncbi:hypothetical protein N185_07805 [Sinorhizobium sp. GW3]|nr:hypothetical protein N185_07805 [Sinorhizobium sp. GW3]KSV82319.1 hypothetical protein N182_00160 [Sinorhizobium sp. GL2]
MKAKHPFTSQNATLRLCQEARRGKRRTSLSLDQ